MGICASSCTSFDNTQVDCKGSGVIVVDESVILRLRQNSNNTNYGGGKLELLEPSVSASLYSQQGGKGINQDAAVLYQEFVHAEDVDGDEVVLCGVFDGHGYNGHVASRFVRDKLPLLLLKQRNALSTSSDQTNINPGSGGGGEKENVEVDKDREVVWWKSALEVDFKAMDKEIKLLQNDDDDVDFSVSGTTAVVAVKQGEYLIVANLGDSRAVLVSRTESTGCSNNGLVTRQLTADMKPNLPGEAERIRESGGRVFALEEEAHVERVWMPESNYPGLAMTRTFGDFDMKRHGVVSDPVVTHHRIRPDVDLFVVLATDGVWDVLTNDEVAAAAAAGAGRGGDDEEGAAKAVVEEARAAWKRRFPKAKVDDCTVACLFFNNHNNKKV